MTIHHSSVNGKFHYFILWEGLCDDLITHPEEFYRLWCVVCDLETSWMRRPWPTWGCRAKKKNLWEESWIEFAALLYRLFSQQKNATICN